MSSLGFRDVKRPQKRQSRVISDNQSRGVGDVRREASGLAARRTQALPRSQAPGMASWNRQGAAFDNTSELADTRIPNSMSAVNLPSASLSEAGKRTPSTARSVYTRANASDTAISGGNPKGLQYTIRRKDSSMTQHAEGPPTLSRKRPVLDRYVASRGEGTELPESWLKSEDDDDAVFGIAFPDVPSLATSRPSDSLATYIPPRSPIPELSSLASVPYSQSPLATSVPLSTGTPSTYYSESIGAWSSRNTTPISVSSYSPGIVAAPQLGSPFRGRIQKDTRSTPQGNLHGQVNVPQAQDETYPEESRFHGGQQSTDHGQRQPKLTKKLKKNKHTLAYPSPPPRKSSMKFKSPSGKGPTVELSTGSPTGMSKGKSMPSMDKEPLPQKINDHKSTRPPPPRRPSRQGTTELDVESSPVIQSDLPAAALRNDRRRRPGGDRKYMGHMAPTVSSVSKSLAPVAQRTLINHDSPTVGDPSPPDRDVISTPSTNPSYGALSASRTGSRESTTRPSKFSSTFGFLGRHKKSDVDAEKNIQTGGQRQKGPAAGTGHEGYKKYAQRGRRTSLGSTGTSRGQSVSTSDGTERSVSSWKSSNPSSSESELDDFVSQRLEPIIIPGGGFVSHDSLPMTTQERMTEHILRRMPSGNLAEQATIYGMENHPSTLRDTAVSTNIESQEVLVHTLEQKPSLAIRRSLLHLRQYDSSQESLRIPSPIRITSHEPAQPFTAPGTINSPIARSDSAGPPSSTSSAGDNHMKAKSSRWNLFSRKMRNRRTPSPVREKRDHHGRVPVAISDVPDIRPVPYYALLDSDQDVPGPINRTEMLEELFDAVEHSPIKDADELYLSKGNRGLGLRREHGQSILLPSPPDFPSQSNTGPYAELTDSDPPLEVPEFQGMGQDAQVSVRPNRLAYMGPIPPVASSSAARQHLPAIQSFSRPFVGNRFHGYGSAPKRVSIEDVRPTLGVHTDPLPSRLFNGPDSGHPDSAPAAVGHPPLTQAEFLTYPSWYGSRSSGSSASNLVPVSAAQSNNVSSTLAQPHVEEDVWKEYDDLIDDVLSPPDLSRPPDTQLGYFHAQPSEFNPAAQHLESPHHVSIAAVPSVELSSPVSTESIRLRRSQIASALHSSIEGSTPSSLAELVAEYEQRNRNSRILLDRMSFLFEEAEEGRDEELEAMEDQPDPAEHQRSTVLLDIAERYREGPVGLSNLRYGALMISRWLSFSRVLFSPVHNRISSIPNERVLVLDGLGNDDWSYYCAETYTTATIYSLSNMAQAASVSREAVAAAWPAPPNHRAVKVNSAALTFPFPQSYFSVVVFRFPAAMPESILRRTISECYRVLQPGGYIEMTVMDLDMMNMGNRTRRAIRTLKVRMNVADPGISLKPASDNILKLLGRRGYQNLNKCIVSIPVAGIVNSGSVGSASSRMSQGSARQDSFSAPAGIAAAFAEPTGHRRSRAESSSASERNFLLSDLIADDSPRSDQRITRMVAKVGRWWYTRCYEWAVLPDGNLDRSIWADKKVLQECENRGTGFKLLIAYAQKPLDSRRRTMSEPTKPTGAVAGGPTASSSRPILHTSI